jgi:Arc/MetJ family transcription regulator
MYRHGYSGHMKKTLHIDENLLAEAREVSGAATDTEAVRLGLQALLRHAAYERLRALRGFRAGRAGGAAAARAASPSAPSRIAVLVDTSV